MTGRMINGVIHQVPLSSLYESAAGLITESPAGSSLEVRAGPHGLHSARPSTEPGGLVSTLSLAQTPDQQGDLSLWDEEFISDPDVGARLHKPAKRGSD